MEIKAQSVYSTKMFRDLTRANLLGNKFLVIFYALLEVLLVLLVVVSFFIEDPNYDFSATYLMLALTILMPALILIGLPMLTAYTNKNFVGCVNDFLFNDEGIFVKTTAPTTNSTTEMKYEFLTKVLETKRYFFLYLSKVQVYPVPKEGVEGGKAMELRQLLIAKIPVGKYKLSSK